jgi:hypothetical protein
MHIQINVVGWRWLIIATVVFLFWAVYRLIKKFIRRCDCGRWLLVERVKIMEPDQNAFSDNILGDMFFTYTLGVCKCGIVEPYTICRKRFNIVELWWRRIFHSGEFNRPDTQVLLEKAGIDRHDHYFNEPFSHKPELFFGSSHFEPTIPKKTLKGTIKPSPHWGSQVSKDK